MICDAVQSVQASRLRHSSPKQPSTEPEELVVPRKTSIQQEDARLQAAREEQERREQRRQDRRRRERHTPLRQIWNQMFRNGDAVRSVPSSPSGTDLPVSDLANFASVRYFVATSAALICPELRGMIHLFSYVKLTVSSCVLPAGGREADAVTRGDQQQPLPPEQSKRGKRIRFQSYRPR